MTTKDALTKLELTHDRLSAAFDLVRDPTDWRAPIDFTGDLHVDDGLAAIEAIRFFTATTPTLEVLTTGEVRIKSVGYRAGPAGP